MGGGGDGGYTARQDEQDRRKQAARDALNLSFGIAPTTKADPKLYGVGGRYGGVTGAAIPNILGGDAGYAEASAADQAKVEEAAANKSAMDALYGGVRTSAFDAGKRRLDEANTKAGRDLKFELLARGLNGSSIARDQRGLLNRTYTDGITDLGGKADSAVASLRSGDEAARLQLLQSIDNGMDQGSALSSAMAQMKNNADQANATAIGTTIGDIFTNSGLLYDQGRRARGEQKANDWLAQYFGGGGGGFRGSPSGIITSTGAR